MLAPLVERTDPDQPIRVWSIGCASGQEPFTIAMLLADMLGVKTFCDRVKIYATDLDEEALRLARAARYTTRELESVPQDLRRRFFEPVDGHHMFLRDLRKCVIFGRHNVVTDAPISRIDLLVCRNLLIYLESDTQAGVLPRLHYALGDSGALFLGKAETQLGRSQLFRPIDMRHRIFSKVARDWRRTPIGSFGGYRAPRLDTPDLDPLLLHTMIQGLSDGVLALDDGGSILIANPAARRLLGIVDDDIGRPFQDLAISYRPIELRTPIDEALRDGRRVTLEDKPFRLGTADALYLTITIQPLNHLGVVMLGFTDSTHLHGMRRDLESAHQSLQQSIEQLQSANEELETTNEELQSTNEELETTNEELQSTNEELETLNEEARSSNEEMEAINAQLNVQAEQAANYRAYLESVLRAMNGGMIVVDGARRIQSWNRWSETTWGLRPEQVQGTALADLDIGLPVADLAATLAAVEQGRNAVGEQLLEGLDRRGHRIVCRVSVTALKDEVGAGDGLVLMFQNVTDEAQRG